MQPRWSFPHTLALLAFVLALLYLACTARDYDSPLDLWLGLMALIAAFVLVVGHGINGVWRGAFIDERNVISLSRFQMLAWTVLILAAYMAATLWNLAHRFPLDAIKLDKTLWILMGISTTSLVASPLILNGKKNKTPDPDQLDRTFSLLADVDGDCLKHQGLVVANCEIRQARWSDMLTGEETGNAAHMDLGRLQMFFFTLVSLLTYAAALLEMFAQAGAPSGNTATAAIAALPALPEGLLA
ncbi:MAG TPA: hypothetical protein VN028_08085, partial [Rhodocyclaceae bacterium]|nr:hypothetical protein [Rhodocyclaceae bacterium]